MEALDEFLLEEVASTYPDTLSYGNYCGIRQKLAQKSAGYKEILTTQFFLELPAAENPLALASKQRRQVEDRFVYKTDFVNAVLHVIHARQFRIQLDPFMLTDVVAEDSLEAFIRELYPGFHNGIDSVTEQFYTCYVTKAIMFFLDPRKTGFISAAKLVSSLYLQSALTLQPMPIGRLFGPLVTGGNMSIFSMNAF